ncbi:glycine C-acetyltransferase [Serpentinicella sp. ANB-PHB4]|uniref:glycine C-acetyltransferase n=1 Tax=Serpentinicella sp. ANB-PHB4 TaxID=3074076 RepID=UPI002858E864|nr:glycine C-acetyltransferase [Serpentinicella sp. ANB-PHB4]MDR5659000.1 glycine C-acetyltransferase [Serpentinicella sp. ANB-PHB4]
MSDVHELNYLVDKINQLKKEGVYRELPILQSPNEAIITLNNRKVVNLSSNNYLGFANHPELKKAAIQAVEKYGVGTGSVRTIIGNLDIHEEMENILATFKKEEAVMVFQSGFNCNAGTIQSVTEKGDLIISDELNHASIIDGSRLSRADRMVFNHGDVNHLETLLKENRDKYNNVLIITDGVFSMDGDIAPLPDIVSVAEKFRAMTYVDDAHGSGVLGKNGRGTIDHFNLHGRVDFTIGTLSKAIGVVGGYVAGRKVMKDWLSHRGRPLLFSTYLPPANVGAIIKAVEILMSTSEYTDKLWSNSKYFKDKMSSIGYNIGNSKTPITPVMIGDEEKTMKFSKRLLEEDIFVSGIIFPTVPKGTGRVRCMVTAAHTKEHLDKAINVFEKVGQEMGVI